MSRKKDIKLYIKTNDWTKLSTQKDMKKNITKLCDFKVQVHFVIYNLTYAQSKMACLLYPNYLKKVRVYYCYPVPSVRLSFRKSATLFFILLLHFRYQNYHLLEYDFGGMMICTFWKCHLNHWGQ